VIRPLGQILVVLQALGEIGDGLDAVGVRGRDQGSVTDNGAGLGLVGEGAGEVADLARRRRLSSVITRTLPTPSVS